MGDEAVVSGDGTLEGQEGGEAGGGINLTKDEYNALIGEMTGLKMKVSEFEAKGKEEQARREIEEQARLQQQRRPQAPQRPVNFDEMSKADFANFILHQVNQGMIQPVLELVMTNVVKSEISEAAGKYDDFWSYKDEIFKHTSENPQLSIDKAYKLAKAENPEKGKKPEPKTVTPPVGERPGVQRTSFAKQDRMDIRTAATKALLDLKDFPEE